MFNLLQWVKVAMPVRQCTPVSPSGGIHLQSSLPDEYDIKSHALTMQCILNFNLLFLFNITKPDGNQTTADYKV